MNSQEVDTKQHGASAELPEWVANLIKKWKEHGDRQSADTQYRIYQMCGELRAAAKAGVK